MLLVLSLFQNSHLFQCQIPCIEYMYRPKMILTLVHYRRFPRRTGESFVPCVPVRLKTKIDHIFYNFISNLGLLTSVK